MYYNLTKIEEKFAKALDNAKQDLDAKADEDGMVKVSKEWLLENEKVHLMNEMNYIEALKEIADLQSKLDKE